MDISRISAPRCTRTPRSALQFSDSPTELRIASNNRSAPNPAPGAVPPNNVTAGINVAEAIEINQPLTVIKEQDFKRQLSEFTIRCHDQMALRLVESRRKRRVAGD